MKYSAILLIVATAASCGGCRHEYEPAPPPYYCQPAGCGCAGPGVQPMCESLRATAAPYLAPTAGSVQPRLAPNYTTVTPAPSTYTQPGGYAPPANPNGSVGSR